MALAPRGLPRHHEPLHLGSIGHSWAMSESTGLAPFTSTHSDDFPAILSALDISLALTTYQSGKLALLSPTQTGVMQLLRTFDNPMGCAVGDGRIAVACRNEVLVLCDNSEAGISYPRKPGYYDGFFLPRAAYFTGPLDVHDLVWTPADELLFVNTRFSCLARLSERHSFESVWRPPFVDVLSPDDRCHLNGLALQAGEPKYATALGATNAPGAWREHKLDGGVVIDVPTGEIVATGLSMPHSPRLIDGQLYVLNSACAQLLRIEVDTGKAEVVADLPGFARGMASYGDYVFVGLSEARRRNLTFGDLPLADRPGLFCGVAAIHLKSGAMAAYFRYLRSAKEIYDVQVLPGSKRPGVLGVADSRYQDQITSRDGAWWAQAGTES